MSPKVARLWRGLNSAATENGPAPKWPGFGGLGIQRFMFSIRELAPDFPVVGNGHVLVYDPITKGWEYPQAWHWHAVTRVKWVPTPK